MRIALTVSAIVAIAGAATAGAQAVQNLTYIGQETFPTSTTFAGTQVGGLSGIAYDPASASYFSVSDDRSPSARFYNLSIDLSDGALSGGDVSFSSVTTLRQSNGDPFVNLTLDPEGIALAPNGDLFVSSEGDTSRGFQPFVNRFARATGVQNLALPVPGAYAVGSPTSGVRNNLAFETLTISPSGQSLFTATENALVQDGPAAAVGVGSPSRILRYDLSSNMPAQEFVYVTEPVAEVPNPPGGFATNGLVDMLAIDDQNFIAVERSFSTGAPGSSGTGNIIKLFLVNLAGATDVNGLSALPGSYTPASKTFLFNLVDLNIPIDNIEGISFGPILPNGQRSIVLVSDNNFSATQFTQFIAFGADVIPAPGSVSVLGLAGLFAARRRR
jgi:hypothetical protein